ncbi:hypothetical protein WN944_025599 [Citrus x changshan-huyou]|uniref:Uncharacterized protein n=1 Tax=Citrus x changshan-huyou TaxID=2935761 RepID=A0AAP0LQ44_9ROSI
MNDEGVQNATVIRTVFSFHGDRQNIRPHVKNFGSDKIGSGMEPDWMKYSKPDQANPRDLLLRVQSSAICCCASSHPRSAAARPVIRDLLPRSETDLLHV